MTSHFRHLVAILAFCGLVIQPIHSVGLTVLGPDGQKKGGPGGTPGFSGTVKSVSGNSLTVSGDGKEMTFTVDAKTKVVATGAGTKSRAKGGKVAVSDLISTGDVVSVSYRDTGGTLLAASVRVTSKGVKK